MQINSPLRSAKLLIYDQKAPSKLYKSHSEEFCGISACNDDFTMKNHVPYKGVVSAHGLKLELTPQGQNVNFSYSCIDCQLGNLRNFNPRLVVLPYHDRNHEIKSRKCSYRF